MRVEINHDYNGRVQARAVKKGGRWNKASLPVCLHELEEPKRCFVFRTAAEASEKLGCSTFTVYKAAKERKDLYGYKVRYATIKQACNLNHAIVVPDEKRMAVESVGGHSVDSVRDAKFLSVVSKAGCINLHAVSRQLGFSIPPLRRAIGRLVKSSSLREVSTASALFYINTKDGSVVSYPSGTSSTVVYGATGSESQPVAVLVETPGVLSTGRHFYPVFIGPRRENEGWVFATRADACAYFSIAPDALNSFIEEGKAPKTMKDMVARPATLLEFHTMAPLLYIAKQDDARISALPSISALREAEARRNTAEFSMFGAKEERVSKPVEISDLPTAEARKILEAAPIDTTPIDTAVLNEILEEEMGEPTKVAQLNTQLHNAVQELTNLYSATFTVNAVQRDGTVIAVAVNSSGETDKVIKAAVVESKKATIDDLVQQLSAAV